MKTKFRVILTLFLTLVMQFSFAQEKTVTGTVTTASDGFPLPGATVIIKGTTKGKQTDIDGKYSIEAKVGDVLVISYVAMNSTEVTVGASNTYDVALTENSLEEVVIVAYGKTTKEAFTGSASVVGAKELALRNVTSPIAAIEGNATGVQFVSASGQPGSSPSLVIRGVGTLNGDTDPLFIVDGVQFDGPLSTINQEDIESFTILKDAASTSLYGSRAANGVVIITTKRGSKTGQIKVNFSSQYGWSSNAIDQYDQVTPGEYYELGWEALRNSLGGDAAAASAGIFNSLGYNPFDVANDQIVGLDGRINPNANVIYQSLDWFDVLEQTGVRTNYNVNVSAGGENHSVFFSASYLEEEGFVVTSDYDRLTTRLNADFQVNDWLTIGGSANVTITESLGPPTGGGIVNPFSFAAGIGSVYPVFVNDLQGNIVRDAAGNPVFDSGEGFPEFNIGSRPRNQGRHALQELLLNNDEDRNNTYGFRAYAGIDIIEGLNVNITYGRDINEGISQDFENPTIGDADPTGRFSEFRFRRQIENFNQIITYDKSFNDVHNINLTAGHESTDRTFSSFNSLAIDLVAEGIFENDNFATPVSLGGSSTALTLEGYFFRGNYNYDNKYFLSGSIRRDGSSVFSRDARWGTFYSAGASWVIDKEDFMDNVTFVDRLKLRASYGEVGNNDLNDFFLSQARFVLTSAAGNPAIFRNTTGNDDVQWETVESFDVALEFTLFDNLIDGSIEYYKKTSSDLLFNLPIPTSNGLQEFPTNIGDLFNSGFEIGLTGHILNKNDFKWDLTLQASTFKNEITSIPNPVIVGNQRWEEGRSRFDFYLFQTAGVDPDNGDQLYLLFDIDENGNSIPVLDAEGNQLTTNDPDDTERAYSGDSSVPDLLGSINNSLSYKGFSLNFLITYGIGGEILDNGYSALLGSNFGNAQHPDLLRAWRAPGDITDVPRLENGNNDLIRGNSTRFLTDASFWALKNINLAYTFNNSITEKLGVDNLRLSLSGENLFLDAERTGLNPQNNLTGTSSTAVFSPARIFTLGLNVSF